MNDLPTVTDAQIVAAQLRNEATRLIRLAEQLEATAPARPKKRVKARRVSLVELAKQDAGNRPARRKA